MKLYNSNGSVSFLFILSWVILFAVLVYFFQLWLEKENNPNVNIVSRVSVDDKKEIVLMANRQHHFIVPGKINDVSVTFMVDTGATDVSIPENIAKKAGLVGSYPVRAQTASGAVTVYLTRIQKLSIGTIILKNIRGNINPHMSGQQVLLGMSALKKLKLTQQNGQLILRQR